MKKVLASLVLIIALSCISFSQGIPQYIRTYNFNSATVSPVTNLVPQGYGFVKLKWEITGNSALSACTVSLQGSSDNVNWTTNTIAAQMCTSDGQSVITAIGTASSYVRVNVLTYTSISTATNLNVTFMAWNDATGATSAFPIYTTNTLGATSDATQGITECVLISTASTNATNCKATAGNYYGIEIINTTSTIYYLRLYNLASAPTCSSATGFVRSIPIPHATGTGAGVVTTNIYPVAYSAGIGFCFTGAATSTDTTNAAQGVFGVVRYK